jgi:CDP-diacylglycerol---glycerol-3-phosphate 3-phosphatidyltransferase
LWLESPVNDWQTKPSDRFVLRWMKTQLAARITPHLLRYTWLQPWMITLASSFLEVSAGLVLALGWAWTAGWLAACGQVLDGVDGQFARLTGRHSRGGAFWDSVLDRYADGAMVIGLVIYLIRLPFPWPAWILIGLGYLALTGSNLISYTSARAETLRIPLGSPTLASKGTRTAVMVVTAWGSILWPGLPIIALLYLVVHTQLAVIQRLVRSFRVSDPL